MTKVPSKIHSFFLLTGLLFGLCLPGWAQVNPTGPPSIPQVPENPPAGNTSPSTPQPTDGRKPGAAAGATGAGEPVSSSSYKIGPADILSVHVWNEGEFSGPAMVHEDGMITLPLVGDLKASGMTPIEVQEKVKTALGKYVINPLVTITVQQVGSKRYYMDGQINRPGEYPLVVPTTILESISKAGGVHEFANSKKIYVLRGDQRIRFNYRDVLRGKNMSQNILLKPDDHVVVP